MENFTFYEWLLVECQKAHNRPAEKKTRELAWAMVFTQRLAFSYSNCVNYGIAKKHIFGVICKWINGANYGAVVSITRDFRGAVVGDLRFQLSSFVWDDRCQSILEISQEAFNAK